MANRQIDPRSYPRYDRETVNAAIEAEVGEVNFGMDITDEQFVAVMLRCRESYKKRGIPLVSDTALTRLEMMCYASAPGAIRIAKAQRNALLRAQIGMV